MSTSETTKYVNKKMVVIINRLCLRMTEGGLTVSKTNLRENANLGFVDVLFNNVVFGEKVYPDIFHQAAAYMFYIIKNHVFFDGNKRTGLAVAVTFLEWNGYMLFPFDENKVFDFVIDVAQGVNDPHEQIPIIAKWFETRTMR